MGKSGKLFLDMREVEDYPPFDHAENFCKKVKKNWLTDKDFARLKSASLYELTQALIDKKMDAEYMDELMKLIHEKEPKYLAGEHGLNYIKLVSKTPIENMERIFKKYDGIDFYIKSDLRNGLELLILNKKA